MYRLPEKLVAGMAGLLMTTLVMADDTQKLGAITVSGEGQQNSALSPSL